MGHYSSLHIIVVLNNKKKNYTLIIEKVKSYLKQFFLYQIFIDEKHFRDNKFTRDNTSFYACRKLEMSQHKQYK